MKSVADLIRVVSANRFTIWQMTWREVVGRYRGSALGILWSLINPLLMLVVYTFVFSVVFRARWGLPEEESHAHYAVLLFAGLILYNFISECVNRAPTLMIANVIYVKKIVFPLEIFAIVAVLSALFHLLIGVGVVLVVELALFGSLPWTVVLFPLLVVPLFLGTLGVVWFLSVFGLYFRDIIQVISLLMAMLLFASPIFYPISALPAPFQPFLALNPLTFLLEASRDVLIFGRVPNLAILAGYWIATGIAAALGHAWFQYSRRGFADVI